MNEYSKLLLVIALIISLAGTVILAKSKIETEEESLDNSFFGFCSLDDEANRRNPAYLRRRQASSQGQLGVLLMAVAAVLQAIAILID